MSCVYSLTHEHFARTCHLCMRVMYEVFVLVLYALGSYFIFLVYVSNMFYIVLPPELMTVSGRPVVHLNK